jgi:hypothetical protein
MWRDLAAAEDQSTQAKAISIALATSAEPSTHERRTNERSTTTTAGAAAAPNIVGPLTEDQHGSYMATVRLDCEDDLAARTEGPIWQSAKTSVKILQGDGLCTNLGVVMSLPCDCHVIAMYFSFPCQWCDILIASLCERYVRGHDTRATTTRHDRHCHLP